MKQLKFKQVFPLDFIAPGWLNVCHKASPFYNLRPQKISLNSNQNILNLPPVLELGQRHDSQISANIKIEINTLIIHNISLPPSQWGGKWIHYLFQGKLAEFSDQELAHPYLIMVKNFEVSSHFMIDRQGQIFQYVSTDLRAWHAGKSSLQTNLGCFENCNDFSIGIELEGDDFSEFTQLQYQSLQILIEVLIKKYPIQYCAAHSYIAPQRKTDPGPYFDWFRLEQLIKPIKSIQYFP